ncbi:YoaK family protein [Orbus wheelerorum]|uniref:YoaK family protein n=1 Tax=Orbus wheelerorum TaxID=3074111 RepID=UPI00370D1719
MKAMVNLAANTHLAFFCLLAFIGGFVDASSFVIYGVFTGHLTGNSVLSMVFLAQMNWAMLIISLISISGFLVGTLLGAWVRMKYSLPLLHLYIICAEFLLFAAVFMLYFLAPLFYVSNLAIIMISLAMGIQNGYFNKSGTINTHSTYITGMVTTCVAAFLNNAKGDVSKKVLLCCVLSFIGGALVGGSLSVNYHLLGFAGVLVLLFFAIIYSAILANRWKQ